MFFWEVHVFCPYSSRAIAKGLHSSRVISVSGSLKKEIQHLLLFESWTGYLPWCLELHHQIKLCSDASSFALARTLGPKAYGTMICDYWPADQRNLHINVKETLALVNALEAFSFHNRWVDVFTDSYSSQSLLYPLCCLSYRPPTACFVFAGCHIIPVCLVSG